MSQIPLAFIIGSSGQVAGALRESLRARGTEIISSSSRGGAGTIALDLADPASVRSFFREAGAQTSGRPAEVFLPGALTHVDRCEDERELCRRINEEGPGIVAEECKALGHKLTFFSTEYVFGEAEYHGGRVGPFSEEDEPSPSSFYGRCKLGAEKKIRAVFGDNALIVRTTMVFSWAPTGLNFLMQYLNHLEAVATGKAPAVFRIPEDQISTPTYAPALAEGTCQLREKGVGGIVNLVGSDRLSRRQLVERVIADFGYDREKSLSAFRFLKTAELGQKTRRPLTAGLSCGKAKQMGVPVASLAEAFADVKRQRGK